MDTERKLEIFMEALEKYYDQLVILPMDEIILDMSRKSGVKPAQIRIAVPDELVKNQRGDPKKRDLLFLVQLPAEIVQRLNSPIILPEDLKRP